MDGKNVVPDVHSVLDAIKAGRTWSHCARWKLHNAVAMLRTMGQLMKLFTMLA